MKYTAANTSLLATVKRIFNHKIYKQALHLYNLGGEEAVLEYLQQFTTRDIKFLLGTW